MADTPASEPESKSAKAPVVQVYESKTKRVPAAVVYVKSRKDSDDDDDDNEDNVNEVEDDDDEYDSQSYTSHGADRLADIESRVSKSLHRITRSYDRGVSTYLTERDKSGAERRDGAIVDLAENASKGVAETISGISPVLTDIAEAFNTKNARRQIRRVARTFGRIPFVG
jgi:hypothetical protein